MVNPPFNNWQIFNTPPGYATTNNPEESFNKEFKAAYTNNERVTMGRVCDIMCTCVYDYSTTHANQPFALVASRNNAIINDAKNRYSSANFILVHSNLVNYRNDRGAFKYYITFSPRFCSCPWFLDVANCRHYIAACLLLGYVDENDREFIIARGRGRPKTARGALTR